MLHLARKAFHPAKPPVPAAADRHDLELQGDVRVPRPAHHRRARHGVPRPHQRAGPQARPQPLHPRQQDVHRGHEPRRPASGARQVQVRRRVRRRPPRRGEEPGEGTRLLVPRRRTTPGTRRTSGPSCGTSTTASSTRASRSGRSRSRTGPSSTSGSTSTWSSIEIVPAYYAEEREMVEFDGNLIAVDDDRMPEELRKTSKPMWVRFRTLGCYPLTGATPSKAGTLPEIIQEMLLATRSEREGRSHRQRPRRLNGREEEARATTDRQDCEFRIGRVYGIICRHCCLRSRLYRYPVDPANPVILSIVK